MSIFLAGAMVTAGCALSLMAIERESVLRIDDCMRRHHERHRTGLYKRSTRPSDIAPSLVFTLITRVPTGILAGIVGLCCAVLSGAVAVGVAMSLLAWTLLYRRAQNYARKSACVEEDEIIHACETICGALRSGTTETAALDLAAQEASGSVGSTLRKASGRARLGGSAVEALRTDARLEPVALAWELSQWRGISLVAVLTAAVKDLVQTRHARQDLDSSLAGARTTSVVLALLPLVGFALGWLLDAHPLDLLFSPGHGAYLLAVGSIFLCSGLIWSDRIIENVEQGSRKRQAVRPSPNLRQPRSATLLQSVRKSDQIGRPRC